jgi:hypothetical protein
MVSKFGCQSPGFLLTGLAAVALFGLWVVAAKPPDLDEKLKFLEEPQLFRQSVMTSFSLLSLLLPG